jgi:hypothetical protein
MCLYRENQENTCSQTSVSTYEKKHNYADDGTYLHINLGVLNNSAPRR